MSDVDLVSAPNATEESAVIETAGGVIPRAASSRLLTHGGITIPNFFSMHVTGAGFPLVAGLLFYGWRALGSVAIVLVTTLLALPIWRRIGMRGERLRYSHSLWVALLLALTLPPHLLTDAYRISDDVTIATWPLLAAGALLIVPLIWLLGGLGSGRLNPVIIANLLLVALFGGLLVPHFTLQRSRIFIGDLLDTGKVGEVDALRGTWISAPVLPGKDAITVDAPAAEALIEYTSPLCKPPRMSISLETLMRDGMPPLEDLIIGGHPGPIGTSCAIAVIIGGLFMLYRGVIDYRIPLLIVITTLIATMVLPVPLTIHEGVRHWRWAAVRHPGVGVALAATFANYELLASPLLFMAFFLATSPAVRPMARRARTFYAILLGILCAVAQLYLSVSVGPYIALLVMGLLISPIDRLTKARTLV